MEKPPASKPPENPIAQLIAERREAEKLSFAENKPSFEGLKSNAGFFTEHPDVESVEHGRTSFETIEGGREDDRIVCQGLREELHKYNLLPDGSTVYLIDFGLPHAPALQETLLEIEIDPGVFTQPSEARLADTDARGYYQRYVDSYREHAARLFELREKLERPKGRALIFSSHADAVEWEAQKRILPTVERLKTSGIKRVVIGKETFYKEPQAVDRLMTESSLKTSEHLFLNQYAKQLNDAGIEVFVIGFDYRQKSSGKLSGLEVFTPYLHSEIEVSFFKNYTGNKVEISRKNPPPKKSK